jgi:hypothetical protein
MDGCSVKRGFLHLRPCGEPAFFRCSLCHRPTCNEHLVGEGVEAVCVECEARRQPPTGSADDPGLDTSDATLWRHRYRDRYYSETDYRPATGAAAAGYYAGTYGAEDLAAFERKASDGGEPWADEGPDFADS